MERNTKRPALTALAVATIAAALTALISTGASATDVVTCDSSEFTKITFHYENYYPAGNQAECLANGGEWSYEGDRHDWVTEIWTGNNRVQWYGDGKWQPDQPIGKNTTFTWPNHPGGVTLEKIRIV